MFLAQYLFGRLKALGVHHTFGIPGDFALPLYAAQEMCGMHTVVMTHEPSVGYAADVYGRFQGLGAAMVTYGAGALNMINAVAMAYAEESPLLVISGAPEVRTQAEDVLFHHRVKNADSQLRVYREITVAQAAITETEGACEQIDDVFSAILKHSRPGYIEIARDLVFARVKKPHGRKAIGPAAGHPDALREVVDEIVARLNASRRPVVYAGVQLERFGLMGKMVRLIEKLNLPTATSLMGKTVLPEHHPNFIGNYFGALGPENVREYMENADCVLALGMMMSEMDVGMDPTLIARNRLIQATARDVKISHHHYPDIPLSGLLDALLRSRRLKKHGRRRLPKPEVQTSGGGAALGIVAILEELNDFLTSGHLVISDTGDSLFAAVRLRADWFIGPGYYASMGLAVPGSIGAQMARPDLRPVVLVGDGAFKMNGVELGTAKTHGLNPIVILINNGTFATLKAVDKERSYYKVAPWDYVGLAECLGGRGERIHDRSAFRRALDRAQASRDFYLIDAVVSDDDASPTLRRLGRAYRKHIRMKPE